MSSAPSLARTIAELLVKRKLGACCGFLSTPNVIASLLLKTELFLEHGPSKCCCRMKLKLAAGSRSHKEALPPSIRHGKLGRGNRRSAAAFRRCVTFLPNPLAACSDPVCLTALLLWPGHIHRGHHTPWSDPSAACDLEPRSCPHVGSSRRPPRQAGRNLLEAARASHSAHLSQKVSAEFFTGEFRILPCPDALHSEGVKGLQEGQPTAPGSDSKQDFEQVAAYFHRVPTQPPGKSVLRLGVCLPSLRLYMRSAPS